MMPDWFNPYGIGSLDPRNDLIRRRTAGFGGLGGGMGGIGTPLTTGLPNREESINQHANPLQLGGAGALNPVLGGPDDPSSPIRRPSMEFRSLLAVPGIANPLAPGYDPLQLDSDSTRREINPVTPVSARGLGLDPLADPFRTAGIPTTDRGPSLLDQLNTKALGPSSLAPAIITTPPESVRESLMPSPTPFPKRRL